MILADSDLAPQLLPLVISSYVSPSSLFFEDKVIESWEGVQQGDPLGPAVLREGVQQGDHLGPALLRERVQQGDPLGPALFCLTIHMVIMNLQLEFCITYLDDITIGGDWEEIVHDFQRVELLAQDVGISLNLNKCDVICRHYTTQGSLLVNIPGHMVWTHSHPPFWVHTLVVLKALIQSSGKRFTGYFRRET